MRLKKVVGRLHLWLGLTSGLVVFLIAITGCLYAFKSEIENATQSYRFVDPQMKAGFLPSQLKTIAEEQLPGKEVHAVLYGANDRAAQVILYHGEPDYYYYYVYIDPYTGEVLKVKNMEADFFQFILDGHFYLWLPHAIGQKVSATATLIFLFMLISGLVLWWPRNKASRRQRFSIRWNARWRRKNYDLHNVVGVYVTWIAIILAMTGLVWGFQWFANGVYAVAGGDRSLEYYEPLSDTSSVATLNEPAIDKVFKKMVNDYPAGTIIEVHPPVSASSAIAANANPDEGTYWKRDFRYFDQYTLKELAVEHIYGRIEETSAADKLIRMNYDIHVGAILGLPGKILVFCASLLCASLPVTGVYIWWGRRKRQSISLREKSSERLRKTAGERVVT
jgi:uncharacterized iron-regulated membrane protein